MKHTKYIILFASIIAISLVFGNATLAQASYEPEVLAWQGGRVYLNSELVYRTGFREPFDGLLYNEAVYIPVSCVAHWVEEEPVWDSNNATLLLGNSDYLLLDKRIASFSTVQAVPQGTLLFYGSTIVYNNNSIMPRDSHGDILPLILQHDILYMPICTLSEMLSLDIFWIADRNDQTIYLRTPLNTDELTKVESYITICSTAVTDIEFEIFSLKNVPFEDIAQRNQHITAIKTIAEKMLHTDCPNVDFLNYASSEFELYLSVLSTDLARLIDVNNQLSLADYRNAISNLYIDGRMIACTAMRLRDAYYQCGHLI